MMPRLVYCLLVLVPAFTLGACQNMGAYSPAYQEAHKAAFWQAYQAGGVDAAAWANYRAHEAAEKAAGR